MHEITKEELDKILENHQHWINADCEGWENMRADLSCMDLRGLDLHGVNLRGANLAGANLANTSLSEANLSEADLSCANLFCARLIEADLSFVNANSANFVGATLGGANLHCASLSGANLVSVNFTDASLKNAYMYAANIGGTMTIAFAKDVPYIRQSCPTHGSFIGWKKAMLGPIIPYFSGIITLEVLVKLEIPEDAKRSSATGTKCRCDKAKVLEIISLEDSSVTYDMAVSDYDESFVYKVGETVSVDNFDENRWHECAPGIHFFINKEDAEMY